MTPAPDLHVFAYGSNLHPRRMQARVPSARPVTIGFVEQRQLRFHKRSQDGSAKADANFTGLASDRIWGVVYRLSPAEKPELDKYEFLGVGYDQELVPVDTGQGSSVQAWMYIARREAIDGTIKPYSWYCDYIVAGAQQHRLPYCYIRELMNVAATIDSNLVRHEHHQQQITGSAE